MPVSDTLKKGIAALPNRPATELPKSNYRAWDDALQFQIRMEMLGMEHEPALQMPDTSEQVTWSEGVPAVAVKEQSLPSVIQQIKNLRRRMPPNSRMTKEDEEKILSEPIRRAVVDLAVRLMGSGRYYNKDGGLYKRDGTVLRLMSQDDLMRDIYSLDDEIVIYLKERDSGALYKTLRLHPDIQIDDEGTNRNPLDIACRDAIYEAETGRVRAPCDDEHYFTCLDVSAYEIGTGEGRYINHFLDIAFGREHSLIQRFYEILGVWFSGVQAKAAYICIGPPNSGKSQLLTLATGIIGADQTISLDSLNRLEDRYTLAELQGKKLCVCPDLPNAALTPTTISQIKAVTGGDRLRGERKYAHPFYFDNEASLVISTNHPIRGNIDRAFEERMVVLPFLNEVPAEERIPNFSELLLEDRGYIIGKALEAVSGLMARNYQFTEIELPDNFASQCGDSADFDFRYGVSDFLSSKCELNSENRTSSRALHMAYCDYCDANGIEPIRLEGFSRIILRHAKLKPYRTKNERGIEGIRLKLPE